MQFTRIPPQHAPLGGKLSYTVAPFRQTTVYVLVTTSPEGTQLGSKRFVAVSEATLDIAPYLRRAVRFIPSGGGTGANPATGRTLTVSVRAQTLSLGPEVPEFDVSPPRTYLPCSEPVTAPALLTSMPRNRLIATGESDELTLLVDAPSTVTVTAQASDSLTAEAYPLSAPGLYLFRLDTRDFPGAESITVDAGACGRVEYTLLPRPEGSQRLAWRSSAGSIEHYTFPVELSTAVETSKHRAYGPNGHTAVTIASQRSTTLASAYEVREVLEALAEIAASSDVWLVTDDNYTPIDVLSDSAIVHRRGTMSAFELTIRPKHKTGMPWN